MHQEPASPTPERRRRRKLLVIPFAVGAAVAAGYAFAAWLSDGAGTGSATARTALDSVISPDDPDANLYPGGSGTITVTVTNPNPYPVIVTSISAGSSDAVSGAANCAAGTVTSAAKSDGDGVTQADGSTVKIAAEGSGTYELTTSMIADAHNDCQGKSFVLPLTAQLSSAAHL